MTSTAVYVSALYDLQTIEKNPQRRSASWYIDRIQLLLEQKNVPIIIYTDEHLETALQKKCAGHDNIQIKVIPFVNLKYVDKLPIMTQNQQNHPYRTDNPAKDTQEYRVIMWNKFEFMADAAQSYSEAQKLIWIDLGIEYVACKYEAHIDLEEIATYFDDKHFCCTIINPLNAEEYENVVLCCSAWRYRQVGGFWSIGRLIFNDFLTAIRAEISRVLDAGCVCMDEEIMARFSYRHPDLCRFNFGDYQSCIVNWRGLRYDIHIAKPAISKAHLYSLHHMAASGWQQLLQAGASGYFHMTSAEMYDYLLNWYMAVHYIDPVEATVIARFVIFCAAKNEFFQSMLFHDAATMFRYVNLHDLSEISVTSEILTEHTAFDLLYTYLSRISETTQEK